MDAITLQRIKLLHPHIRDKVREAYLYANNTMLGKGVRLRFSHTLRTIKEQDELYAQGRTKLFDRDGNRLGVVTWASGGYSYHNYGLAWDIVLLVDKDKNKTFESASWNTAIDYDGDGVADWKECVEVFKSKLNCAWGGDWIGKKYDAPHFQLTYGNSISTLRQKIKEGRVFFEEIDGVKYQWVEL